MESGKPAHGADDGADRSRQRLAQHRQRIARGRLRAETELLRELRDQAGLNDALRERIPRMVTLSGMVELEGNGVIELDEGWQKMLERNAAPDLPAAYY